MTTIPKRTAGQCEVCGHYGSDCTGPHEVAEQPDPAKLRAFVEQFAHFSPYVWDEDEGWEDEQGGDAIASMNDLIVKARAMLGLTPLPDSEVGEQEHREPDGQRIFNAQGQCIEDYSEDEPEPCTQHKDTGRGVCAHCGVAL